MKTGDKKELYEKFMSIELQQLLDFITMETLPYETRELMKQFICENYGRSPRLELVNSIKELEEKDLLPEAKTTAILVKTCARDIIDSLDIESITSLSEIKIVVDEKIKATEVLISL